MSRWRQLVLGLMRVPPEPHPPPGSPPRVFRAARNFFYLKLIAWVTGHFAIAVAIVFDLILTEVVITRRPLILTLHALAILATIFLVLRITFGFALVRLDYELRWYMISDRAIRIREGIVIVKEKTIALANIQNTVVKQGPLQRLLGIADVEVRTAGGGGSQSSEGHGKERGEPMHVGYFRGVDNAAEIRDIIVQGVRRHRDAGLGDPEDAHGDPAAELLQEVRALRVILSRAVGEGSPDSGDPSLRSG